MASDIDRLQGTWAMVAFEADGRPAPAATFAGSHITVKKNTFTSASVGASYEGTFQLDEASRPKTITLLFTAGPQKGTRHPGIYTLDGDRWTLCLATSGTRRPARFATKTGTGLVFETLERVSAPPKKTGKPVAHTEMTPADGPFAPPKPLAGSGKPTVLEGEWTMEEGVFSGAALEKSSVAWCRRSVRGNETRLTAGSQVMLHATFTIDPSAAPHAIDYVNLAGPNKGKAQAGIWDLKDGLLRICMAAPGKPRPADFLSTKGDGRSFTTWKRSP